jgi:hypothetical protein
MVEPRGQVEISTLLEPVDDVASLVTPRISPPIPTLDNSVEQFHQNGFCILENLFNQDHNLDSSSPSSSSNFQTFSSCCLSNFFEIQNMLQVNNLPFGVGLKEGYDEIVQRHPGRYEITYQMKNLFQSMMRNEYLKLLEIVQKILGTEIVIANESLLISDSGTQVSVRLRFSLP